MSHKTCEQQGMNQEKEFLKERSGLQKLKYRYFFQDLFQNRRKLVCEEESQDEELNNADQLHQEIVQDVVQEVCTDHPIMYDIYDICDYSRQDRDPKQI